MHRIQAYAFSWLILVLCQCAAKDLSLTDYYHQHLDPGTVTQEFQIPSPDGNTVEIDFNSLTWREGEVSPSQWRHRLNVFVPKNSNLKTGFIYISNGSYSDEASKTTDPLIRKIATENNCVAIEVKLVPNQGLTFFDEEEARFEDDLIAYSWKQYLKTGDRSWMAQYPMAKSIGQIMDFAAAKFGLEDFIIAGQSKRGWTSWLVAAVDQRVRGVVPMVIDLVNIEPSMTHHKQIYNGWSWPLKDYEAHGIGELLGTPNFDPIASQLDPIRYIDRLTMPKLVINAANDEFFLPDSSQFYFDQLRGEKGLRYLPNSGHRIPYDAYADTVSSFVDLVINNQPLPKVTWGADQGRLQVVTDTKPTSAILWMAHNPSTRDFRLAEQYPKYTATPIRAGRGGKYLATVRAPDSGWKAYFMELTYNTHGKNLKLTTPVFVKGSTETMPKRKIGI